VGSRSELETLDMADPPPFPPIETNDAKPWDPKRIFQRLNSPSFRAGGDAPLKGDGHAQGTRRSADFPQLADQLDQLPLLGIGGKLELFEQAIALAPGWVRTEVTPGNAGQSRALEDAAEQEVYGKLLRSFQTWTDAPGFQWHRWYDWNFHVQPAPEFDHLRGAGNRVPIPPPESESGAPDLEQFTEGSLECEWDAGAFSRQPGGMFTDLNAGTRSSWIWPMTDDFVWISGRSIYDGGHEFQEPSPPLPPPAPGADPPPKPLPKPKLCRSELHPCRAMAMARKEAFRFQGTPNRVPAHQFVFFASRLGGYISFESLDQPGDDYEFVVDLPLMPDEFQPVEHPIGKTPDFPFNRIVLRRPEPLIEFEFEPFLTAFGSRSLEELADFEPEVTIITPKPDRPREKQARIKIPLRAFAARFASGTSQASSYGVIVHLGWTDALKTQAREVKRVRVQLRNVQPVEGVEFTDGEWRLKFCVNNRWLHLNRNDVEDEDESGDNRFPVLSTPIEFFLHKDDSVRVHMHGMELNIMDDIARQPADERTVRFNRIQLFAEAIRVGEDPRTAVPGDDLSDVATFFASLPLALLELIESLPVLGFVVQLLETLLAVFGISPTQLLGLAGERVADWRQHIDARPPRSPTGCHVVQRVIARNTILMLAESFNQGNAPLAMCDPGKGFPSENELNPLPVRENRAITDDITLKGIALKEDSKLAELFEHDRGAGEDAFNRGGRFRKFVRYELNYQVEVTDQEVV
jgi:hypothetical protein